MNQCPDAVSQASKIREDFRKQIRRRDIDRRMAQKRRQIIQQLKVDKQSIITNAMDNEMTSKQKFNIIYGQFLHNPFTLTKDYINELASISTTQAGSRIIMEAPIQFIHFLIAEYMFKEQYAESEELDWVLMVLNNVLTVCNNNYKADNIAKNSQINALTTTENFILKLFSIALDSKSRSIKENATTVIFCMIYNNQPEFVRAVITNPKFSMISLFYNQMQTQPHKDLIIETLRCYYLAIKKLDFQSLEQFGKMRKFILMAIRNSNCLELTVIGVISLNALLRCLPNEKEVVSSSKIIFTVFVQTLALNNTRLAIHAIKLASFMMDGKNQEQVRKSIQFLQKLLCKFGDAQLQTYVFKVLYELLVNSYYPADKIVDSHKGLVNKMMELFQSNAIHKSTLIQVCYCLCVLAAKSYKLDLQVNVKITQRVRMIIDEVQLDEKTRNFLQQSLSFIDSTYQMNDK